MTNLFHRHTLKTIIASNILKVFLVLTTTVSVMSQTPCQTGEVDTSFGVNGKIFKSLETQYGYGPNIALQTNGKIVVAAIVVDSDVYPQTASVTLFRYNSNGSIDQTFNGTGNKTVDFKAKALENNYHRLIVQNDGKILVATIVLKDGKYPVALVRLNEDGSADASFGNSSVVYVDFFKPADDGGSLDGGLFLQSDGKILAVGVSYSPNSSLYSYGIARYNPNGIIDQSFGTEGKVLLSSPTFYILNMTAAAVQPDDKIVVAVETSLIGPIGASGRALFRFNPNGSVDKKFGIRSFSNVQGGVSRLPEYLEYIGTTSNNYLGPLSFKSDGNIIASLSGTYSGLVQFSQNAGTIDKGFGSAGVARIGEWRTSAKMVFVQPDDKIVSLYNDYTQQRGEFAVFDRHNSDGTLDYSFGSQSRLEFQFQPPNYSGFVWTAVLQPNGDFIAFGTIRRSASPADSGFALMRFRGCQAK